MVAPRKGAFLRVRFDDPDNLASCANFFAHAFPGDVKRDGQTLRLIFQSGNLQPAVQKQIVGRLLWAWRRSHLITHDDGFILPIDQDQVD